MQIESGYWPVGTVKTLDKHHNQGIELVLVESGQTEWEVESSSEWVTPGMLFFTLPWQEHGDVAERNQGLELYFVILPLDCDYKKFSASWNFHPDLGLSFDKDEMKTLRQSIMSLSKHAWIANAAFKFFIKQVHEELARPDFLSQSSLSNNISNLLIEFIRSTQQQAEQSLGDSEQRVANFIQTLQAQCHEAWTLDDMAAVCELERTQFAVHAQRVSGLSPKQLLNHMRINRAKELLRHGKESITNIAFQCGFESSQYFARVFKKIVGMDASSFRRKL